MCVTLKFAELSSVFFWHRKDEHDIEMAVALMLVAVIVAGVMTWMSGINQQLQLRSDVKHFSRVAKAAELYLNSERGELIKEYNSGVREKVIRFLYLYSKGYLPKDVQTMLGKKINKLFC